MLRLGLFAVAIILAGATLAGCSSSSMSDMFKPSPPPPQVLPFQSVPAGATVQTAQGQTCSTPCSLALPVTPQAVSFSLNGYVAQTIQLTVRQGQGSLFSTPPPELVPDPVVAQLQALPPPPPKRAVKPRPRRGSAKPRAPMPASMSGPTQPSIAAPEQAAPAQDNVFPPPPPTSASPFPPPPPTR